MVYSWAVARRTWYPFTGNGRLNCRSGDDGMPPIVGARARATRALRAAGSPHVSGRTGSQTRQRAAATGGTLRRVTRNRRRLTKQVVAASVPHERSALPEGCLRHAACDRGFWRPRHHTERSCSGPSSPASSRENPIEPAVPRRGLDELCCRRQTHGPIRADGGQQARSGSAP
jgi:hypothetical protein